MFSICNSPESLVKICVRGTLASLLIPLPPEKLSAINQHLLQRLFAPNETADHPYFEATSWTTDAPYRETQSSIAAMKTQQITCVEMEAAALYALAEVKQYDILCFAHLTNSMAQKVGDFEKGDQKGSIDTLHLLTFVLGLLH